MEPRSSPGDLDYAAVFAAQPTAAAVFAADPPRFTVLAASEAMLAVVQRPRDAVVGLPLAEAFQNASHQDPRVSGLSSLRASLAAVVQTRTIQRMDRQRYHLPRPDGGWQTRYWNVVNIPLPGPDGAVRYVLHQTSDVTARVHEDAPAARAERRAERILERVRDAHCVLDRELRIESVNATIERALGVPQTALVGRSHREVFPPLEDAAVGRAFRRVVADGVEQHLVHHYTGDGGDLHLEVDAYPTDEGGLAVFWRDVTARVRGEAALRASEAGQAYLVRLGDALRPLARAFEIEQAAARCLGEHLGVNRAFFAEVDGLDWPVANAYEHGVEPPAEGRHALAQFGEWIVDTFRAGERLVIRDLHADVRFDPSQRAAHAAYHILGAVAVPLVKEGLLVAILVVHTAAPRDWTEHEIALVAETAERTWTAVERARAEAALRASEARYRTLFESMDEGFLVAEVLYDAHGRAIDALYLEGNPAASRLTGVPAYFRRGLRDAEPGAERYWLEIYDRVGRTGVPERLERYTAPLGRWYDYHVSRLEDGAPDGARRVAVVFQDVTTRKRAEHALRESEERLRRALSVPTVGVLFFRLDGAVLDANAALEHMIGYTLAELRGLESCSVLALPEFEEVTARAASELAARGETAAYEKQWRRKDGSLMWGLSAPTRLAGSGRDSECVEFVIDITRAKEADAALRESERRLAHELTAAHTLQQVSTELISETEPRALYAKLVDAAVALMRADAGSLQMLERDGRLSVLASKHVDPELEWQRLGADNAGTCGLALERNERVMVSDIEACDYLSGTSELDTYRQSRLRALQSTPLVARDRRAVGMLSTHWHHPHEPSANELALIDVLAREAADLIDRVQTQTALRERTDWLRGQGDALTAAVNGAPLQTSLGALVRTATEALGAGARGAFYLASADGTTLQHVLGMTDEHDGDDGYERGPESLGCDAARRPGEPVVTDMQTDPRWEPLRWMAERFQHCGYRSFPIHSAAGTLVGTLVLDWPHSGQASARERELAALLTNTAAIIISQHREAEERRHAEEALRASLGEREALLRELHHRVKNNLQVIMSMLEMQARHVSDPPALPTLMEARNRIGAIGTIHELLYQSGSLSRVDLLSYAKRLVPHVVSLYERSATIRSSVLGDEVTVDLARAVPIGLLLNELISNVCKHAFPMNAAGELTVAVQQADGRIHLRVADSGTGLPAGFSHRASKTLGLQLVHMLAKQLGGTVEFHATGGTVVDVRLPR